MRPIVTVRRASVATAAFALAIIPSMAGAATTWSMAHPPYTAVDNVPLRTARGHHGHLRQQRLGGRPGLGHPADQPLERQLVVAERAAVRTVQRVRGRLRALRSER
jgi:hypothetical protein